MLTNPVLAYNRHRLLPLLAPILPSSLTSRLAHYTPLSTFSFSDQVAAGLSSGNFDVERDNLASGSSDSRMGLDEAGVEEVRRIMYVLPFPKEIELTNVGRLRDVISTGLG